MWKRGLPKRDKSPEPGAPCRAGQLARHRLKRQPPSLGGEQQGGDLCTGATFPLEGQESRSRAEAALLQGGGENNWSSRVTMCLRTRGKIPESREGKRRESLSQSQSTPSSYCWTHTGQGGSGLEEAQLKEGDRAEALILGRMQKELSPCYCCAFRWLSSLLVFWPQRCLP